MSLYIVNTHSGKEILIIARTQESAENKYKKSRFYEEGYSLMEASMFYNIIGSKE